ncbi:TPA: transcription antitermination factor NusB, partial [Neisseria gonorrhoeae]
IRPLLDRDEKDLNPIERAVLLTACHELSAMPETPYPVIINEAIEVTKTFGGTDGHKFVNGILDKLAAQIRPDEPKRR